MTPEQDRHQAQTATLERAVAAGALAQLKRELAAASTVLLAAQIRGATPVALRTLVRDLLGEIVPSLSVYLDAGRGRALELGRSQALAEEERPPWEAVVDEALDLLIGGTDDRVKNRLDEAVVLAQALPMTDPDDLLAVLAKARSAVRVGEVDAGWAVHRGVALGHAEVAKAAGLNLVWIAERNACPSCLAYQGHVVAPGRPFPPGLTYGDRPVAPFGQLLGPPLHPHCRCQVETTGLDAGTLDPDLAREAARSIARGLTDYASEAGKARAVDRLLKGTTGLPPVKLPKTVLDRAARNLVAGQFKARPGSPGARAEIAQRARDRARVRRGTV